jgi:hypothetical protein
MVNISAAEQVLPRGYTGSDYSLVTANVKVKLRRIHKATPQKRKVCQDWQKKK